MKQTERLSNQAIIQDIQASFHANEVTQLTARPINFYQPHEGLWWLIPSTEWPAFRYAKLTLFRRPAFYCFGLHVEKGVSGTASLILKPAQAQKWTTKSDWAWNTVVKDLENGRLESRLKLINEALEKPLRITLQASTVTGDREPFAAIVDGVESKNVLVLEYHQGETRVIADELKGELRKFGHIQGIEGLAPIFHQEDMNWFWFDLFISVDIDPAHVGQITAIAWIFLEHFQDYLHIR